MLILTCSSFKITESRTDKKLCQRRLHFSFRGIGRTGDGELRKRAAVVLYLVEDKHLENKGEKR